MEKLIYLQKDDINIYNYIILSEMSSKKSLKGKSETTVEQIEQFYKDRKHVSSGLDFSDNDNDDNVNMNVFIKPIHKLSKYNSDIDDIAYGNSNSSEHDVDTFISKVWTNTITK